MRQRVKGASSVRRAWAAWGRFTTGLLSVVAVAALWISPAPARAQEQAAEEAAGDAEETTVEPLDATVRTMVLRDGGDVDPDVAAAVDGELLRALRDVAGVDEPTPSPVSFEELATAAGCEAADATCLESVAQSLDVSAVLLRRLEPDSGGNGVLLTLVYDDPHLTEDPPRAERSLAPGADLGAIVDSAVRALFGIPEPPSEAAEVAEEPAPRRATPGPAPPPAEGGSVTLSSAVVLGVGGLVLLGGAAAAVLSLAAQSDYEDAEVTSREDADRALDRLETAEDRATVANVLFMVGAAVSLTGAVMLALDLGVAAENGDHVDVALAPTPAGGMISVGGTL